MTTYLGKSGRSYRRYLDRALGARRPPRGTPQSACVECGREYADRIGDRCDDCMRRRVADARPRRERQ